MKRFYLTALLAFAFGIGLALLAATPSMAVHRSAGDLSCGGCHTMHNSENNASMGGASPDGTNHLLRAASAFALCASCHFVTGTYDGTTFAPHGNTAPKVWLNNVGPADPSTGWAQDSAWGTIPAGGFFDREVAYTGGTANPTCIFCGGSASTGYGHSLTAVTGLVTPPGGDIGVDRLRCHYCHDVHGTDSDTSLTINRFRNLLVDAEGAGANSGVHFDAGVMGSWVGGINGANYAGQNSGLANHYWPIYDPATGPTTGNSNFYGKGATVGGVPQSNRGAISQWCAQCHDNWHEDINTANISSLLLYNKDGSSLESWKRHPIDKGVYDAEVNADAVDDIDWTNYSGLANTVKMPATNTIGSAVYYADTQGDRVMCLSCHFPHAGPYKNAVRWEHTDAAGNAQGIPSYRGCQQCHNRGA